MVKDAPTVPVGLVAMLDMLAEMIVESLGFGVAVFNIALSDGSLEVVSVAGDDDARAALMGNVGDAYTWDRVLEISEHWGRLRFAEHAKADAFVDDFSWIPEFTPSDGEDAWHPQDQLFAPLTAADGTRLGILSVDLPRGLRRPDAPTRSALEAFVVSAALAIENRSLSEELKEAQKMGRVGSFRVDLGTGASAWSEELYRLLGCDPDTPPWPFADFRGRVHPCDVAALDEVLGSGESGTFEIEFRIRRADERLVWLRMLGETQRSAGSETARMIATLQEVTESKIQELRLREALSQGALIRAFSSAANESPTFEAALALSADHLAEVEPTCHLSSFVVATSVDSSEMILHPMSWMSSLEGMDCGRAAAGLAERAARERRVVIEDLDGSAETAVAYPVFS
ncbi:MAG: PAS domain-containing protein, partial [Actinobacteria bacterium]|nr:PAS domain-containing protein [Actinomycetota bacterium]